MALKAYLEELLATITDPAEREQQRKFLESHPQFQEAALRQNDYDRFMNTTKEEREREKTEVAKFKERAEVWENWAKENKPRHEQLMDEYKKLTDKNKELETAVAEAARNNGGGGGGGNGNGGGGGEVDETRLMARVQEEITKRGFVSSADVQKIAVEEARKLAQEERASFFKDTLPNVLEWNQKMMDFNLEHRQEFGTAFDRKAFSKYVSENKLEDLDKAYSMFVSEKRTENKIKIETEKRVKDELSKHNLPGSGAPPSPESLGPVQQRRGNADGLPAEATVSEAAMAAAAELRKEGKY